MFTQLGLELDQRGGPFTSVVNNREFHQGIPCKIVSTRPEISRLFARNRQKSTKMAYNENGTRKLEN